MPPCFTPDRQCRRAWLTALGLLLAGCATDRLDLAPPSLSRPWPLPEAPRHALRAAVQTPGAAAPAPGKPPPAKAEEGGGEDLTNLVPANAFTPRAGYRYDLPGLIDLAQRHNPETREAWERARQAALAVGLAESAYLPQIAVEAVGGWQHTPIPIPRTLIPQGYFTVNTFELVPMLTAKWLLFDFGQREGQEEAARSNSFVANVAFTGAHQKLIYSVSRDYFALGAASGRLKAAEQALAMAKVVEDAAERRRVNGLATVVELAQARQQTAQARYNLERAKGGERSAYAALIASMGIAPGTRLEIADSTGLALPQTPSGEVDDLVQSALANRPDILAAYGKIKAAQAQLGTAEAAYYPTIGLEAEAYQNIGGYSTLNSPIYQINRPGGNLLLKLSLPLFDGGDREARIAMAQSQVIAAQAALDQARDGSVRDVNNAYDALRTGFSEYEAALSMEQAAETAYAAAMEAYRGGVGLYTDVATAENGLSQARFEKENAHANVFTAAAALAFATGGKRPSGR